MSDFQSLHSTLHDLQKKTAKFVPVAFHVHSPDSHDWPSGKDIDKSLNDRQSYLEVNGEDLFLEQLATRFSVACITDHMKTVYACRLVQAAKDRDDILVLPGMEVNCRPGGGMHERIHLLTIFPPDHDSTTIDRIFSGQPQLPASESRTGQEEYVPPDTLTKWIHSIHEAGGIVIAAHIDQTSSGHRAHFRAMRESSLNMFITDSTDPYDVKEAQCEASEQYKALAIESDFDALEINKPDDRQHYLRISDTSYRTRNIPCVVRSDQHSIEALDDPKRITYLKLSQFTFQGVRDALRFHETRVKFHSDLPSDTSPKIVGLRLRSPSGNGLFTIATFAFNQNLNCLIGPRGCGKSTAIEALRYVVGQNPKLDKAASDKTSSNFAQSALGIQRANLYDTIVELIYENANGERHCLQATYDEKAPVSTKVYTFDEELLNVLPGSIPENYPVRIYSWGEVETLGREPELQRSLIDSLIPDIEDLKQQKQDLYSQLANNRQQIEGKLQELQNKRLEADSILLRYREYLDEFNRLNSDQVASLFSNLDELRSKQNAVATFRRELEEVEKSISEISEFEPAEVRSRVLDDKSTTVTKWWDEEISPRLALSDIGTSVSQAKTQVRQIVSEKFSAIDDILEQINHDIQDYEAKLREQIQASPEDELVVSKRENARKRYEQAKQKRDEYQTLYSSFQDLLNKRKSIINEITKIQAQISHKRSMSSNNLVKQLNEFGVEDLNILIEISPKNDRLSCLHLLRDEGLLGKAKKLGKYLHKKVPERCCNMATPIYIARAIWDNNKDEFTKEGSTFDSEFFLTEDEASKIIEGFYPYAEEEGSEVIIIDDEKVHDIFKIEEKSCDDRVEVRLDQKAVDRLSPGERSSAMVPLIALSDNAPLVIDQPEDNLDNRRVGKTLTKVLAQLKERRQIIVATHNPNIVVGGDAEQVIVLKAPEYNQAEIEASSSIDDPNIVQTVIQLMEGGEEAFIRRERRYQPYMHQCL